MASSTVRVLLYVMFGFLSATHAASAASGIELELPRSGPNDLRFEKIDSIIEPVFKHPRDPYWQYYADCDRWGVEFSTSETHETIAPSSIDTELATLENTDDRHKSTEWQPRRSKLNNRPAQKHLSISKVLLNKAASIGAKFRFQLERLSIDPIRPWTESIEFHAVESRNIDFDLITVRPGHPVGTSIHWLAANLIRRHARNGLKNRETSIISGVLDPWNSAWIGITESDFAKISFKFLSESEAKRVSQEFAIRMEMADQIDSFGTLLHRYADSIRFVAVPVAIESNRESIAKKPKLQLDNRSR